MTLCPVDRKQCECQPGEGVACAQGAARAERIAERRRSQPVFELQRKADKSRVRARYWTQEEVDLGQRLASDFYRDFIAHVRVE